MRASYRRSWPGRRFRRGRMDKTAASKHGVSTLLQGRSLSDEGGPPHLKVGVQGRCSPGFAPRSETHPRKLGREIVDVPASFSLALLVFGFDVAAKEGIAVFESTRSETRAQAFEGVPDVVGVGEGGEGQFERLEEASAEENRRRVSRQRRRSSSDRVQECERDLYGSVMSGAIGSRGGPLRHSPAHPDLVLGLASPEPTSAWCDLFLITRPGSLVGLEDRVMRGEMERARRRSAEWGVGLRR